MKPPIFQNIKIKKFKSIERVNISKLENFNCIVEHNSLGKIFKATTCCWCAYKIFVTFRIKIVGQLHFYEAIYFLCGSNSSIINVNDLNDIKDHATSDASQLFGNHMNFLANMEDEYTLGGDLIYSNDKILTIYRSMRLNDNEYIDQYKFDDQVLL